MATVKTAISLQKSLFEQADALADKLNVSRSHLFVMAVEDYIERHQNRTLLEEINRAYTEEPDQAEAARLMKMRKVQRKVLDGEW
jgi:metal-responsive CopG/Arc/MetJ family transcriptional regulator